MVIRNLKIVLTAMVALAATTVPCFAGSWDDLAGDMKQDAGATSAARAKQQSASINRLLFTKNRARSVAIEAEFASYEKRMRELCAPDFAANGTPSGPGKLKAAKQVIQDYIYGKASFLDAAFANKAWMVDADLHSAGPDNLGKALMALKQLQFVDKAANAARISNERASWIAGQYPGSSMSCSSGNGVIAWDQSEVSTFRHEHTWKVEKTDGRRKTTYTAEDNGGFSISIEYGQFSAAIVLARPGQGIIPADLELAVGRYNLKVHEQMQAQGQDAYVSDGQAMVDAYKAGKSDSQIKAMLKERAAAKYQALPEMFQASMAGITAKANQMSAQMEHEEKARNLKMTGGVSIQDSPFKIIALNLDSTRDRTLSEKDAMVKQNALIQHVEAFYHLHEAAGDIVTFLNLVLENPDLRQNVAK